MTKLTKAEREELPARIEAAIATVCSGMAAMSIPANPRDVDLVLADCAKALADLDAAEAERDARSDEAYEARELRSVLLRHNFAPCDTAACNCNGWHERSTGNGFYARFREIDEAVGEHDGQTLLDAVKQIVVERKAAVLWAEKAEKAMTCKGCGGTVSDHLAPDQGGCPGSFEIDGVQMVPLAGRDNAVAQRDRAESELDAERKMRVEAEAASDRIVAELATLRADRDAALIHLPVCCGSLADAADTLQQERDELEVDRLLAALREIGKILDRGMIRHSVLCLAKRVGEPCVCGRLEIRAIVERAVGGQS